MRKYKYVVIVWNILIITAAILIYFNSSVYSISFFLGGVFKIVSSIRDFQIWQPYLRVYFFKFELHSRLMMRSIDPFILQCMYLEAKTSSLALIGSALERTVRE